MTLDYSHKGEVELTMFDYVDKILVAFNAEDLNAAAGTPK
jgi:hypothetical protein